MYIWLAGSGARRPLDQTQGRGMYKKYRSFRSSSDQRAKATHYRMSRSSRGITPCVPSRSRSGSLLGAPVHCDKPITSLSSGITPPESLLWTEPGVSVVSTLCWLASPVTCCAPTPCLQPRGARKTDGPPMNGPQGSVRQDQRQELKGLKNQRDSWGGRRNAPHPG